jgi:hypothetical protein
MSVIRRVSSPRAQADGVSASSLIFRRANKPSVRAHADGVLTPSIPGVVYVIKSGSREAVYPWPPPTSCLYNGPVYSLLPVFF